MKQIGNWVFGSFFRTIGRLLVFVLLGILLAHLIDFGSLKDSFSITDLFFTKIKADTYSSLRLPDFTNSINVGGYIGKQITLTTGGGVNNIYIEFEKTPFPAGVNEIRIPIRVGAVYNGQIDSSIFYNSSNSFTVAMAYTKSNENSYSLTHYCVLETSGGAVNQYPLVRCPKIEGYSIKGLVLFYTIQDYSNNQHTLFFGYNRNATNVYNDSYAITNSINSQTQQQQQQHNETQSYLEDSNTTQAESEATDFFDDFDAPDAGGLSAIITAPLNTIRSLLNSSCTNLVLPLPYVNENLTLPCMTSIYTQHFGAFFTIYQTIILAIIAYRCIRSIFFDIHGFTNPNDDRIEVMDL